MTTLRKRLDDAVGQQGLIAIIVASADGEVVAEAGDIALVAESALYADLFGGSDAIQVLYSSLEGQILPRVWRQDDTQCYVSRIGKRVYGAFSTREKDPLVVREKSRRTAAVIDDILAYVAGHSGAGE